MTWFLLFVSNFGGSWNLSIIFGTLIIFDPPMMSLILYMFLQFSHAFYPSKEKKSGNKKPRCSKGMIGRSRLQMWTSWMPFTREEHKIFAAKRRLQSDFISRIHCSNRLQCIDEVMIIYKKCTLWIQDLDDKKKAAKSLHKRQIKHEKSNIINKNSEGKWSLKIDSKHFDLSCQILVLQMITCNAHAVLVIMPCATRTFPASDSRVGQVAIFLKMKYKLITGLGSFFFFQLQKLRVGCQSSTCPTVLDAGYKPTV